MIMLSPSSSLPSSSLPRLPRRRRTLHHHWPPTVPPHHGQIKDPGVRYRVEGHLIPAFLPSSLTSFHDALGEHWDRLHRGNLVQGGKASVGVKTHVPKRATCQH